MVMNNDILQMIKIINYCNNNNFLNNIIELFKIPHHNRIIPCIINIFNY